MESDTEYAADAIEHMGHGLGVKRIAQGYRMALPQIDSPYGLEANPAPSGAAIRDADVQWMRARYRSDRADNSQVR